MPRKLRPPVFLRRLNLAAALATGDGAKQDLKRSAALYAELMDKGVAEAAYNLATMVERGEGVRKDIRRALKLYSQAEEMGSGDASLVLAYKRAHGAPGLRRDRSQAACHCALAMINGASTGLRDLNALLDSHAPLTLKELRQGLKRAWKRRGMAR
jgi:TPR repeat protein